MEEQWQLIQMELQSKILEDKKMEDERIISQADLSQISNSLGALHDDLRYIDNNVNSVKNNVGNIYSKIDAKSRNSFGENQTGIRTEIWTL